MLFLWIFLFPQIERTKKENYFVYLNRKNTLIRQGPGSNKLIKWVLTRSNYPLKVKAKYEHWRFVSDKRGNLGWIHKSFLGSKRKYGLVFQTCELTHKSGQKIQIGANNIVQILKSENDSWLVMFKFGNNSNKKIVGLMPKNRIWGEL